MVEARELAVALDRRLIIQPLSLSLRAGEFVALIGPSGAGKTTLLRALAGALPPHAGDVLLDGQPVGHVPAEDLLHPELTLGEELYFAAALRSPRGTTAAELDRRTLQALSDLRLSEVATARIATLSKGQRRRASCGVELVGEPGALLLDEPAGGLDPALEARLMQLLRGLADAGRTVLAATHATASLALCDRIVALDAGGALRYDGPPGGLSAAFGVVDVEAVYTVLAEVPREVVAVQDRRRVLPARPRSSTRLADQLRVLVPRGIACRMRDTRTLGILLGQAPVLGIAIAVLLPRNAVITESPAPYYGVLLAFMLLTASIWLGAITACRELVSEKAIVRREAAVGVLASAQVLARCATVLPIVALQTALLVMVAVMVQPIGTSAVLVVAMCVVAAWASACMGLWLSAASQSGDQATSTVPLLLIPQLLFAGALIPVARMTGPLQALSEITVGRWAFTGIGGALQLDDRLGSTLTGITGLDGSFFAHPALTPLAAMGALGAVSLCGAVAALRRDVES